MGSTPIGVQCPLTSSLGEFLGYWLTLVSCSTARIGVHRLSIRLSYLSVFHSLFFTCHWISFVFLLYGKRICTHSVDSSLAHSFGEFPGLGLAMVPDVVVPEAEQGCAWNRNLDPNLCPGRGRTPDLGI